MENTQHNNQTKEDMKISGDDILGFFRKIFKAGNSRSVVFKNEIGEKIFKINLILMGIILVIIPALIVILLIIMIALNYSVSIEKKHETQQETETTEKKYEPQSTPHPSA